MALATNAFTSVSTGTQTIMVQHGSFFEYSTAAGAFSATYLIERTVDGGLTFQTVVTGTAAVTTPVRILVETPNRRPALFRVRCTAYTSGTMTFLMEAIENTIKVQIAIQGNSKVGGTAGYVVGAADNLALVTLPASQTGSKLIVTLPRTFTGAKFFAFHLIGNVTSAGNAVTVDCDFRKSVAAAAAPVDSSLGTITQVSVTANTALSFANTRKVLATPEIISQDTLYYWVITGTTALSTTHTLQSICIEVTEPSINQFGGSGLFNIM